MHTSNQAPDPLEPIDYLESKLPVRLVAVWVGLLAAGVVAVMAFVYFVYGTPQMQPDAELVLKRPMNQPVLQSSGAADMTAFKQQQEAELNTYGWVNQAQGIVRLPIQKAIDKALERGYPSRGAQ